MKLKLVIAVSFFAFFGLMNKPFIPVPVRMTTYSLAYIPSILSSGMIYWYYDSTMEAKHTVLTTAAKSVVGWHSTLSTTFYGQLTIASIWSTEIEEYWNNNGNQTCVTILPSSIVGPTFLVSLFEFQVIKALIVFYPYEVLALNHDILAYPLVASAPIVSGIIQLMIYHNSEGLCSTFNLKLVSSKMEIVINFDKFIIPNLDLIDLFILLILLVEACIRLKKYWKVIRETVMLYTVCWWKNGRAVHPSSDQPSSEMLELTTYLNPYKGGCYLVLTLFFGIIKVLSLMKFNVIDVCTIIIDCALLGLPICWVITSDDISTFIKLKYSQLKYRLGHF